MHRQWLLERLSDYRPMEDGDRSALERFFEFVRSEPTCFERELKIGHITGSAWIVDPTGTRVLLTHHRKLGFWLQLGGHADGESDVLEVALREAREESGLPDIRPISEAIFDLDIHPIPARGDEPRHFHYDVRFALQVHGSTEFVISPESLDLAWIDIENLPDVTTEESMLRMRRRWYQWRTNAPQPI